MQSATNEKLTGMVLHVFSILLNLSQNQLWEPGARVKWTTSSLGIGSSLSEFQQQHGTNDQCV
jgi:hypothetical protein